MKHVGKNKIINIPNTDVFENSFVFERTQFDWNTSPDIEVFFMGELLKQKENTQLLQSLWDKYAMFANVYSEEDELEIFTWLFDYAIKNNKKIHIVWVTLQKEIDMLEAYYTSLWFLREDVNCFVVDFSQVLVSVSVHIENLMWKGSDYKRMGKNIFFLPPIREAGLTKAMYKAINRGSIAHIYISKYTQEQETFLQNVVKNEHILPLTLAKVLKYSLEERGFWGESQNLIIHY